MTSPVVWICLFAAIISCRSCTPFGHSALDNKEGPCEGQFCNGHGTCQEEGIDNYTCWCEDGYKGKDCEEKRAATDIQMDKTADERSNDVHHRESYAGLTKGPCEGQFCNGHGMCQEEGIDNYTCWCDDGYKGKDCEEKRAATDIHMDKTADERSNDVHRRESYAGLTKNCKRKKKWKKNFCVRNVVYGCYRHPAHYYAWCWKQVKEGSDAWCWVKKQWWDCSYSLGHADCRVRSKDLKCDDSKSKEDQAAFCAGELWSPNPCN